MTGRALLGIAAATALALLGLALAAGRPRRAVAAPGPAAPAPPDRSAPEVPGLAPALAALCAEVDAAWPRRSRASDGGAPSVAHHAANPNSDHERGDAYDFTHDASNGPDLNHLAAALLRDARTAYVIWDRRIANRSIGGGAWRPYAATAVQTDPHVSHLHVSVDHASRDHAGPWDLASMTSEEASA